MDAHAIRELERQRDMLLEERQMWRRAHMTLTDAEREAIEFKAAYCVTVADQMHQRCAATLRGLLERTK